jgi:hypothetical protein
MRLLVLLFTAYRAYIPMINGITSPCIAGLMTYGIDKSTFLNNYTADFAFRCIRHAVLGAGRSFINTFGCVRDKDVNSGF